MPIKSVAQRAFLHIHHPKIARRWERETPKGRKLPKHVSDSVEESVMPSHLRHLLELFLPEARFPDEKFWSKDGDPIHPSPKGSGGAKGLTMKDLGAGDPSQTGPVRKKKYILVSEYGLDIANSAPPNADKASLRQWLDQTVSRPGAYWGISANGKHDPSLVRALSAQELKDEQDAGLDQPTVKKHFPNGGNVLAGFVYGDDPAVWMLVEVL